MSDESIPQNPPAPESEAEKAARVKTFSRRALVQAGWVVPIAAAISIPRQAGAASAHADGTPPHGDSAIPSHNDFPAPFSDTGAPLHGDAPPPHSDFPPPHVDG